MTKTIARMQEDIAEQKEALRLARAEQEELAKAKARLDQLDRFIQKCRENYPHPRGVDSHRRLAELRAEREEVEAKIRQLEGSAQ